MSKSGPHGLCVCSARARPCNAESVSVAPRGTQSGPTQACPIGPCVGPAWAQLGQSDNQRGPAQAQPYKLMAADNGAQLWPRSGSEWACPSNTMAIPCSALVMPNIPLVIDCRCKQAQISRSTINVRHRHSRPILHEVDRYSLSAEKMNKIMFRE